MRKFLYVRANNFDSTSAIPRALAALEGQFEKDDIIILEWKRRPSLNSYESRHKVESFYWTSKPRSLRAIFGVIYFQFWLAGKFIKYRPHYIQFFDFVSSIPSVFFGVLLNAKIVYDMRDPFAWSYSFNKFLYCVFYSIDWLCMAMVTAFVLPMKGRKKYLGVWNFKDVLIIPNTTNVASYNLKDDSFSSKLNDRIVIGYFGYLHSSRGEEMLLNIVKTYPEIFSVVIAGGGISESFKSKVDESDGIYYLGFLSKNDVLSEMRDVDFVSLLYDPTIIVNRYAAPNKFYESLALDTPIVATKGMIIAKDIEHENVGVLVEYTNVVEFKEKIVKFIENKKKGVCQKFYYSQFSYTDDLKVYSSFYKNLLGR